MRVRLGTVLVDESTRRAIAAAMGKEGLATREEIREWVREQLMWAGVDYDED